MKNTKENAQLILGKYCGLNDETSIGEAVLNAMIEYATKINKLNKAGVSKSAKPKSKIKVDDPNSPWNWKKDVSEL